MFCSTARYYWSCFHRTVPRNKFCDKQYSLILCAADGHRSAPTMARRSRQEASVAAQPRTIDEQGDRANITYPTSSATLAAPTNKHRDVGHAMQ